MTICSDTTDSFTCRCNSGYIGDGRTCTQGTVNDIRYDFNTDGDKEGWTTQNLTDLANGPNGGLWIMRSPTNDPVMLSPQININASSYSKIEIKMANDHNPIETSKLQVFWNRFDDNSFSEAKSSGLINISNGGAWETYIIDLSTNTEWRGEITKIRIDPIVQGDGHSVGIDYIVIKP